MDNNFLYQAVMFFSAAVGCLGAGALLALVPWLPLWLAWGLAILVGGIYAWFQAEIATQLPYVRERWAVTPAYKPGLSERPGCLDVFVPYFTLSVIVVILVPVFREARQKARAAHHLPPDWSAATLAVPPVLAALPFGLTGLVAVAGWRLRASRRLYHMAMECDVEGARRLLEQGEDPNSPDPCAGRSPLLWAIMEDSASPGAQMAVVRLLLERGADSNLGDRDGVAPLFWAVTRQRLEILTLLLAHGADPNRPDPRNRERYWPRTANDRTPLMAAAPFPELAQALLAAGADVRARDADGATALIHASRGSNWTGWRPAMSAESIRLLLRHGAEVNERDHSGRTALIACARSSEIAAALLDGGADVNAADHAGVTPLIAAAGRAAKWVPGEDETPEALVRLLLERGADVHARDATGRTGLQAAEEKQVARVVELLRQAGATE